jgi:hypothetical protein
VRKQDHVFAASVGTIPRLISARENFRYHKASVVLPVFIAAFVGVRREHIPSFYR